ncbi:MAG: ankyrin repeat domain-containing protein [bacterium]
MKARNYWKEIVKHDICKEDMNLSKVELLDMINRSIENGTKDDLVEVINNIFIHAAKTGKMDVIKMLVENSYISDINIHDEKGRTALDYAQFRRDYETIHYLVNQGVAC